MRIDSLNKFEKKVLRGSASNYIDFLTDEQLDKAYFTKEIKKKDNSSIRSIQCINNEHPVYKIQKQLKSNFFDFIPLSNHAYGYVRGKSYYDHLKPHVKSRYYLKLDIKDFFPSIRDSSLREVLEYFIDDEVRINNELPLLDFIIKTVTFKGSLPQGAVTSPVLSNIYFTYLDIRISRYCQKFGVQYSRYVDDLLFSSDNLFLHKKVFANGINKILRSRGFQLNSSKIKKTIDEISLNGFVVGENIRLSRRKLALVSGLIYCYQHSPKKTLENLILEIREHFNFDKNQNINLRRLHNYLAGYRSFLLGLLPFDSVGVMSEDMTKANKKILFKVNEIEKILDLTATDI